ncbi:ABC transporter substrate-binding protein [Burkholderia sp. Bp9012]|uniref:DUF5983 family protein n=1 Tax=Burkholderia sp. Bp9012 TaxID=2184562 RepID=UPI000F58FF25|nr:ABC transporter substrate-binding protein [Burkholderia sp. Bp9012]RQR79196.1 ABC transporter substrate-binding protein [Burkholderia sp. Bp9012]
MSNPRNPFERGYQHLRITRSICIIHDSDWPPVWRTLHPSQSHLPDSAVERFPCIFNDTFAVVTEGQDVAPALDDECRGDGTVHRVVYAVMAEDLGGRTLHVGDTATEGHAQEVVRRLRFDTGFFSRCWEISIRHLTEQAYDYLLQMAHAKVAHRPLFEAFQIPGSSSVGVKLIGTPWPHNELPLTERQARQAWPFEKSHHVVPDALTELLDLAGQADVRILVFDPDAPALDGLRQHNWDTSH